MSIALSAIATDVRDASPSTRVAQRIAKRLRTDAPRMRLEPRLWDYCYFMTRNNLKAITAVAEVVNGRPDATVVDLGCGKKPFRKLFRKDLQYVGVDISAEHSLADVVADLNGPIELSESMADAVLISETLEHVQDPHHLVSEACRILKPGGKLYISTPFSFPIHSAPHDYTRPTEYFYRSLPRRLPLQLQCLSPSNQFFVTPLQHFNLLMLPAPLPTVLRRAFWLTVNLASTPVEWACRKLSGRFPADHNVARCLRSNPLGYAVILEKLPPA